jgi:hypothetical protein
MKRALRMVLGGLIVFVIMGGVSILPVATRELATLNAQTAPATLKALQAVPRQYRQEVISSMTPEAVMKIVNELYDQVIAAQDTSPELRSLLQRMKKFNTAERLNNEAAGLRRYHAEVKQFKSGLRTTMPDIADAYDPEYYPLLQQFDALPELERRKADWLFLPEIKDGGGTSAAFWLGITDWLDRTLRPAGLSALPIYCRCYAVQIGPMPCDDPYCMLSAGVDHLCSREDCTEFNPPFICGSNYCNGGCYYCY